LIFRRVIPKNKGSVFETVTAVTSDTCLTTSIRETSENKSIKIKPFWILLQQQETTQVAVMIMFY